MNVQSFSAGNCRLSCSYHRLKVCLWIAKAHCEPSSSGSQAATSYYIALEPFGPMVNEIWVAWIVFPSTQKSALNIFFAVQLVQSVF